jgi:heme/copper-type cytochrome/quinol oxidase subunit 3
VAIGMIAIGVLAWLAFAGDLRADRRTALEAITVYWHFVDIVWVILFSVIYLWTLF